MSNNIGKSTSSEVGVAGVVLLGLWADMVVNIRLDSGVLVPGTGEVFGETTRIGIPGRFGNHIGISADRSHVWQSRRILLTRFLIILRGVIVHTWAV